MEKNDVFIYDAEGKVYYVKGYLGEDGQIHYSANETTTESKAPIIKELSYTLTADNKSATVTVIAEAANGGNLIITGGGTTATKVGENEYQLVVAKNGTIVITAKEEESIIIGYAFTMSEVEPTTWNTVNSTSITQTYITSTSGTYYFWVKNERNYVSSQSLVVTLKQIYTITYDANGGTNAPNSQEKIEGQTLILTTNIPTRLGYEFLGWATSMTATNANYQSGGNYTKDENITLYAVWKASVYTISYQLNGATNINSIAPSWVNIIHFRIYTNCEKMYPELNSHEMKNSEWGAVTYLAYSPYGINGNEVAVNQCSSYYTGAGKGKGSSTVSNGTYAYSEETVKDENENITAYSFAENYAWNTDLGKLASTTGNIYGVYDLSGGAWEYVACYLANGHRNLNGYGGILITTTDLKMKQIYPSTVTDGSNSQSADYNLTMDIYGDAVYEVSTTYNNNNVWCNDSAYYMVGGNSLLLRGNAWNNGNSSGIFCFGSSSGNNLATTAFRPVLCIDS